MSAVAKRSATSEPVTYSNAGKFIAMGYAPIPVAFGHSMPRIGGWSTYVHSDSHMKRHAADGVGIMCAQMPSPVLGVGAAALTHVAALEIDVRDKTLAAELERVILKHLVFRDGATGASPVRVNSTDLSTLRPFALTTHPYSRRKTREYYLQGDKHTRFDYKPHKAELHMRGGVFLASGLDAAGKPFTWRNGDLTSVHHDALPILDGTPSMGKFVSTADLLMQELEAVFEARAKQWL